MHSEENIHFPEPDSPTCSAMFRPERPFPPSITMKQRDDKTGFPVFLEKLQTRMSLAPHQKKSSPCKYTPWVHGDFCHRHPSTDVVHPPTQNQTCATLTARTLVNDGVAEVNKCWFLRVCFPHPNPHPLTTEKHSRWICS